MSLRSDRRKSNLRRSFVLALVSQGWDPDSHSRGAHGCRPVLLCASVYFTDLFEIPSYRIHSPVGRKASWLLG